MAADDIPVLLKHVSLAIYKNGYGSGSKEQRFWHCFDAARWRLVEWGYLAKGSQKGPVTDMRLTAKGRVKNAEHMREPGRAAKAALFLELYERIITEVEGDIAEPQETAEVSRPPTTQEERADAYRAKQQESKADAAAATPRPQQRKKSAKAKKARVRYARRRT